MILIQVTFIFMGSVTGSAARPQSLSQPPAGGRPAAPVRVELEAAGRAGARSEEARGVPDRAGLGRGRPSGTLGHYDITCDITLL